MQADYSLRYLRSFHDDLSNIIHYISHHLNNPQAAMALLDEIDHAILKRLSNPEAFERFYSQKERQFPYYRIYVKNYVIYYVVITEDGKKIMEVRRLLYGKRNRQNFI